MGFMDTIKRAGRGLAHLVGLGAKPSVTAEEAFDQQYERAVSSPHAQTYPRSTTATRRFHRDANREYNHISMPVTEHDQRQVSWFGFDIWRKLLRTGERAGTTYNVGINAEKRRLKALGLSKRELKFALRTFRTQLRAQGIK